MARDYQRIKQSKYILPRTVYHQTLWRIRDYYRLKECAEDLLEQRGEQSGQPKSNTPSDIVGNTVMKRDKYLNDVYQIDCAIKEIPEEYRRGVWNSIHFGDAYPQYAARATYGRYKAKFIYKVAERFNLI